MRRRGFSALLCLLLVLPLFSTAALADSGPKPSVRVRFENMGEGLCYGTLLSRESSTGPASAWSGKEGGVYDVMEGGHPIWEAFQAYEDPDGFYFLQWWWPCSPDRPLRWSYYPPKTFKVLLYFPETDTYRVSGVYERYAFHSDFTADLARADPLVLEWEEDYVGEGLSLLARLAVTLLVELGLALLFDLGSPRLLLSIAGVNVATQLFLNAALHRAGYHMGGADLMGFYLLLEAAIQAGEAGIYRALLPRLGAKKERAIPYALTANLSSFLGGFLLAKLLPFLG